MTPCRRFAGLPGTTFCLILLGSLALLGCNAQEGSEPAGVPFYSAPPSSFQQAASRDSALSLLEALDQETMRTAFARLSNYEYTRHVRTEQLDETDGVVAFEESTMRYDAREEQTPELLSEASEGNFDFGFLGRFVSAERPPAPDPSDAAAHILPDEPAYLSPQHQEAYLYQLLPDTTLWGQAAKVVEVRADPETGENQNIRYVRLYLDRSSQTVIGLTLIREERPLLFREASRFTIFLRPEREDWVPHRTHFRTRMHLPFQSPKQFRTVSMYEDYARIPENST